MSVRPGRAALLAVPLIFVLSGCESLQLPGRTDAAAPPSESIVALYQRPPERALIAGLRFYEDGVFDRAEQSFRSALLQGLRDRRDAGVAHKYLAFIACAFNRIPECEQQFRNAFGVDPSFRLTDAEIGHPIWGPVYKRVAARVRPAEPQRTERS